ncbi:MAG: polyamine ABC transporter substrate-binding protein [Acidisphaera sp.]|nr:polyamine ABC transporter substrate-binding protein [Acidisphaera sp.]
MIEIIQRSGSLVTRRMILRAGASGAALSFMRPCPVRASEEIVVTMYGGPMETGWRRNVVDPFQKESGIDVTLATGLSLENLAKMRAQRQNPELDVVAMDTVVAVPAARERLYEQLDPKRIPVMNDLYDWAIEPNRYYLSWLSVYYGLAYNTQRIPRPTSWEDMWNPAYKGHVIFPDISNVGATYVMHILNTIGGGDTNANQVDVGFRRIASLKPQLLTFWTNHDQVGQLLSQGDAWITPWPSDRLLTLKSLGAPVDIVIPKEGVPFGTSEMGITKGTKHQEAAERYLNFALSPEAQARNAETIFVGPTNKKTQVPAELAHDLGMNPGPEVKRIAYPDWSTIAPFRAGWIDRWNREIK